MNSKKKGGQQQKGNQPNQGGSLLNYFTSNTKPKDQNQNRVSQQEVQQEQPEKINPSEKQSNLIQEDEVNQVEVTNTIQPEKIGKKKIKINISNKEDKSKNNFKRISESENDKVQEQDQKETQNIIMSNKDINSRKDKINNKQKESPIKSQLIEQKEKVHSSKKSQRKNQNINQETEAINEEAIIAMIQNDVEQNDVEQENSEQEDFKDCGDELDDFQEDDELDDLQANQQCIIEQCSDEEELNIDETNEVEQEQELFQTDDLIDNQNEEDLYDGEYQINTSSKKRQNKAISKNKAKTQKQKRKIVQIYEPEEEEKNGSDQEETIYIDNLPNNEHELREMLRKVKKHVKNFEKQFFEEEDSEKEEEQKLKVSKIYEFQDSNTESKSDVKALTIENSNIKQLWCIPLSVNVTLFDFDNFAKEQKLQGGRLFDIITIDPPWQFSSANPIRGVAIGYETLSDNQILDVLPFDKLQTDGFLFVWVINTKYRLALELLDKFNYKVVDEIAWVKQTNTGKIARSHGYYLQHAKETCLIGVKGNVKDKGIFNIESDVIFSRRRGQSQKPEEIYAYAESLIPNGYYLEIFGRRNNLHNGWVTMGNEI